MLRSLRKEFMRTKEHEKWVTYAQGLIDTANAKALEYGEIITGMGDKIIDISNERDIAKADLLAIAAERDGLIDTLREVQTILSKVPEYDGLGALPVITATQMLVADHSELEARIEAVLVLPGHEYDPHQIDTDGGEMVLDRDEVHRLLRGGQRVPDTIEGIED